MEVPVLKIEVTDVVKVYDFTAPPAVTYPDEPVLSTFFQPEFVFTMEEDGEGEDGNPRGPTMTIDFELMTPAAFL